MAGQACCAGRGGSVPPSGDGSSTYARRTANHWRGFRRSGATVAKSFPPGGIASTRRGEAMMSGRSQVLPPFHTHRSPTPSTRRSAARTSGAE